MRKKRGQAETKLTGEMRLVIKEILKLHQEQGVAFKEIALLTSSRSRNDQILLALSEYGFLLKPTESKTIISNP